MEMHNVFELEGMQFPSRKTRVMVGANGSVRGEHFCQGYVVIEQGGSIPLHAHETVETYTIIEGKGRITVDSESREMSKGDFVYIERNKSHTLSNIGDGELHMMFVYAPSVVADHWAEEAAGRLK